MLAAVDVREACVYLPAESRVLYSIQSHCTPGRIGEVCSPITKDKAEQMS